jgi:NAD(P)-dependent dehydrogenase (short-subunit alcohol dehydrogenase family)
MTDVRLGAKIALVTGAARGIGEAIARAEINIDGGLLAGPAAAPMADGST